MQSGPLHSNTFVNLGFTGSASPRVDSVINKDVKYFMNSSVVQPQSGPHHGNDFVNLGFTVSSSLTVDSTGHSDRLLALIDVLSTLATICIRFLKHYPPESLHPFEQDQEF